MEFKLSAEQSALADNVRRFTEREYGFARRRAILNSEEGLDRGHWQIFAELGWLGAGLSEAAGGFGGGAIEYALIAEQFGRALVVEPFAATVMALRVLEALGAEAVQDLISQIVSGEVVAVPAQFELAGRGDPGVVTTQAERDGRRWRLTGAKSLVPFAAAADHLLVTAQGPDGLGLFRLDRDVEGVTVLPYRTVDGARAGDLRLDRAPAEQLGEGARVQNAIETATDHGTMTLCAEAVGAMEAALWMTRDYLRTRKQFGQPIGSFQALAHRMADMLVQCELARSMLFQGLAALEQDAGARRRGVSAAKMLVGEAGLYVGRQSIQLHGGIGMTDEFAIGHYYKRLFAIAHVNGDSDMHLERFAARAPIAQQGGS